MEIKPTALREETLELVELQSTQQQAADLLLHHIRTQGSIAVAYEADLSTPDNIPLLFDLCETQLGGGRNGQVWHHCQRGCPWSDTNRLCYARNRGTLRP